MLAEGACVRSVMRLAIGYGLAEDWCVLVELKTLSGYSYLLMGRFSRSSGMDDG